MKNLHIFDVSGVVYYGTTGSVANSSAGMFRKFPIAGIKPLMTRLSMTLAEGDDVLLAFDGGTFRKELLPTYKGNREPNRSVGAQIDFLYDQLAKAGIPVVRVDGYEADDVIYWAVCENINKYDAITIHSNDHDVAHNVQCKVSMKPFSRDDAIITNANFEYTVQRGKKVRFNTISAYKVFTGCSSDNIPSFKISGRRGSMLYSDFLDFLDKNKLFRYEVVSSYKTLAIFINSCGLFSDTEKEVLYDRIRLVFPAEKPEGVVLSPVGKDSLDLVAISEILLMCRERTSVKNLGVTPFDLPNSFLQLLDSYSQNLNSGAYSVDRDLEVDPSYEMDSASFFLKEF